MGHGCRPAVAANFAAVEQLDSLTVSQWNSSPARLNVKLLAGHPKCSEGFRYLNSKFKMQNSKLESKIQSCEERKSEKLWTLNCNFELLTLNF